MAIKGLVVTFKRDVDDDGVEHIINAILMIKNVISVDKSVADLSDHLNRTKMLYEFQKRIYDAIMSGSNKMWKYDLVERTEEAIKNDT